MKENRRVFAKPRIVMRPPSLRPMMVQLGRYNYSSARSGLPEHRHRSCIEICFLVKGRQTYRVGRELYSLRGGDVFVTFPNEIHSTGGMPEEKGVLYWIILATPQKGEKFAGLNCTGSNALVEGLSNLKKRHFRGSQKMKEHLDTFTQIYHQPKALLRECALANQMIAFLLEVHYCVEFEAHGRPVQTLDTVLDYIQKHSGEELGIPKLAKLARLSEARFKARFRQETGIPPGEFVLRVRIEEAKRLLLERKKSITDIAFDLGFSTSQYFATVFRRFTGMTPKYYQQTPNP